MVKQYNQEIATKIAIALGVDETFIEKDFYIKDVLQIMNEISDNNPGIICAFAGGTSLSKAYNVIKRFSEDVDIKVISDSPLSRGQRRSLMKKITRTFEQHKYFNITNIKKRNEHQYLNFNIEYPKKNHENSPLRPSIKIELNFEKNLYPAEVQAISTIIDDFMKNKNHIYMPCVSIKETSINKVSALMWRLSKDSDPTLTRHLHDLSALESSILKNNKFRAFLIKVWEQDKSRSSDPVVFDSIDDQLDKLMKVIEQDKSIFEQNYNNFVDTMAFGDKVHIISFDQALKSLENIINFVKGQV